MATGTDAMQIQVIDKFTPADVAAAGKAGWGFVCSMCNKAHAAKAAMGVPWDELRCFGKTCCGPMGGRAYPEYEGPLGNDLSKWCFRCGKPNPENAITTKADPNRLIGVCNEHLALLKRGFTCRQVGTRDLVPQSPEQVLKDIKKGR